VARELVGAYLVRRLEDGSRAVGRIVEVEAYLGDGSDPAAHSHNGPTPRNGAMFGPPGRLYVYRIYGIHLCANVVCEPPGRGAAVLFRALEPVEGAAWMRRRRGLPADAAARVVAGGPGRLAQAFALELADDRRSLLRGALTLRGPAAGAERPRIASSRRIGVSRGAELPFRFFDPDSPCLSRRSSERDPGGPGKRRRRAQRGRQAERSAGGGGRRAVGHSAAQTPPSATSAERFR
jgi:DNA-3-methyladenine glycosylase